MILKNKFRFFWIVILIFLFCTCGDKKEESYYPNWSSIGEGLNSEVSKNVLTEFVGSTKCPYCPAADAQLLSFFDSNSDNYVGTEIASKWYLINYHTYSPTRGDPMYEFHRGTSLTGEDDYCYVRFEEGSWYSLSGVPTTYTNGVWSNINSEMAVAPMQEQTPLLINLEGTTIEGSEIDVRISIKSSKDMSSSDSLHLFICATIDNVSYTGSNGEPYHQDVFLGWINEGLSGEMISIGKEEIIKDYSWEMPSNWPQNNYETSWSQVEWDESNLAVVAFVQNKYTKEILQVSGKK